MAPKNDAALPGKAGPDAKKSDVQSPGPVFRAWAVLENISASRRTFWFCAVVLPLAVLAYYPSSQALFHDFDLWFHLAYGKHYVENLTWRIDHSMFSWIPAINPPSYVTWLGSSVLYLVHGVFGVPGLVVLHYGVLLASGALVFMLAKAAKIRPGPGLLAGLLLAAVALNSAGKFIKPEMFSTFMVTLAVAMYLRFRMAPGPWVIAAFPVLFLFWVNTHGLWQFGLVFLGLAFAVDLVICIIRPNHALDRKALVYMAWAAALTFLALCVNPFGPSLSLSFIKGRIFQVFSIFFTFDGSGGAEALDHYRGVAAYQSMWEHLFYGKQEIFNTIPAVCMAVMIIVFLPAWGVSWKRSGRADLPVAVVNIVFFFMGMFMGRLILVYPLIWILSLVFLSWRAGPKPLFPRTGPLALAAFLILSGITVYAALCMYPAPSWFGAGYRDYIPDKEARYILDHDLPGPLFNDYLSGGYLMWVMYPQYKVFIDSRHFPYKNQVYPDYNGIGTKFPLHPKGLRDFTDIYPARIALINHREQGLIHWFHQSPEWTLVYFDKVAVVMVRKELLPTLSRKAKSAMLPPSGYADVVDPVVLTHLYNLYKRFLGPGYAAQIRDLFEQNVSDLYWDKKRILGEMNQDLGKR
jgi:hypothetical protein